MAKKLVGLWDTNDENFDARKASDNLFDAIEALKKEKAAKKAEEESK